MTTYCKNYCEEKGISTSKLNEAQGTLYYIAENMKMDKSISEEGYRHFQMAIKALEHGALLDEIREDIENLKCEVNIIMYGLAIDDVIDIIDKYKAESDAKNDDLY